MAADPQTADPIGASSRLTADPDPDGIGRVQHGVLCIAGPEMTADQLEARFVTPH